MNLHLLPHTKTATGIVVRPHPSGSGPAQTLLFLTYEVHELQGGRDGEPFRLGPPLTLYRNPRTHDLYESARGFHSPVYLPATNSVYFVEGYAVMRLDSNNKVSLVAGNRGHSGTDDGPGPEASFGVINAMASDGFSTLYVAEDRRIRKLAIGGNTGGGAGNRRPGSGPNPNPSPGPSPGPSPCPSPRGRDSTSLSAELGCGLLRSPSFSTVPIAALDDASLLDSVGGEGDDGVSSSAWPHPGCLVGTLPGSAPQQGDWVSLAFDCARGELLASTRFAVCRVRLPLSPAPPSEPPSQRLLHNATPTAPGGGRGRVLGSNASAAGGCGRPGGIAPRGGGASGRDGGDGGVGAGASELVAGAWVTYPCGTQLDGPGTSALFACITSLAMGGADGCVYLTDNGSSRQLRVLDSQRSVSTLVALPPPPVRKEYLAVLPAGCRGVVAVCGSSPVCLVVRDGPTPSGPGADGAVLAAVGFTREHPLATGASAVPQGHQDNGDGASSSGREGGTSAAVLTIRVGPKSFVAHRSLLCARSEYFRQLLGGSFAESGAAEASLPDADPDAFALLLEFMYTGVLDVPDSLLRRAAELASRLLLPNACRRHLAARLLAACTPASVVQDMLWAQRLGGMADLVSELKARIVRHREVVPQTALAELAAASPSVAAELEIAAAQLRAPPPPTEVAKPPAATQQATPMRRRGLLGAWP